MAKNRGYGARHARAKWRPICLGAGLAVGLVLLASGCVPSASNNNNNTDGNVGVDPAQYPGERVQGEPNDSFDTALTVILDNTNHGHLAGAISPASDVDAYVFKTLQAGDRLIIDVGTNNDGLDASVGVFDEAGRILFENDDRSIDPVQLDPYLNQVIRRESRLYYLAVYRSGLATQPKTGAYEALITVVPGGQVPPGEGQVVVLDFDGGSITLSPAESYAVGPFDTADISPYYAGMTAAVGNQIAATVLQNYEGLSLDVRVLPPGPLPAGVAYSTVLFGGRSPDAFGQSQNIDAFNNSHSDSAIVFTGMFTPSRFGRVLSATELGTAIGHIASHELGHLLGLNHVDNVHDLMDTSGDTPTLLGDMRFGDSPLDPMIAPLGTQDSFLLLLEALGSQQ